MRIRSTAATNRRDLSRLYCSHARRPKGAARGLDYQAVLRSVPLAPPGCAERLAIERLGKDDSFSEAAYVKQALIAERLQRRRRAGDRLDRSLRTYWNSSSAQRRRLQTLNRAQREPTGRGCSLVLGKNHLSRAARGRPCMQHPYKLSTASGSQESSPTPRTPRVPRQLWVTPEIRDRVRAYQASGEIKNALAAVPRTAGAWLIQAVL
jgi:hypothetical protein